MRAKRIEYFCKLDEDGEKDCGGDVRPLGRKIIMI